MFAYYQASLHSDRLWWPDEAHWMLFAMAHIARETEGRIELPQVGTDQRKLVKVLRARSGRGRGKPLARDVDALHVLMRDDVVRVIPGGWAVMPMVRAASAAARNNSPSVVQYDLPKARKQARIKVR